MALAARGARETEHGRELIDDAEAADFFQRRARGVYLKAFVATLVVMVAGRAWLHFVA